MRYTTGIVLELNRLLLTLHTYATPDGLSPSAVEDILKATTFGGRLPDHASTIGLALDAGMINRISDRLVLTPLGREFIRINEDSSYELAPGQAWFLARALLFDGKYRLGTARVLRNFRRDAIQRTLVLASASIPRNDEEAITLLGIMRDCGVLEVRSDSFVVNREFLHFVSRLCARRPMTQLELDHLLDLRNAQGEAAEQWVLEFETRRLQARDCLFEAAAIQKTSMFDVVAGYDIASFNGRSPTLSHDRFIEVKSTSGADPEFIWSENELVTARSLRTNYWIYLVLSFGLCDQNLVTVQDPATAVDAGVIELNATTYRAALRKEPGRAL